MEKKSNKFYHYDSKGEPKISQLKLINFLGKKGFALMKIGEGKILVKIVENIVEEVDEGVLSRFISNHLKSKNELDVLEVFIRGLTGYLNKRKYDLLPIVNVISDKHLKDSAFFYFSNTAVRITKDKVEQIPYKKLNHKIWNKRLLDRAFNPIPQGIGQFEDFCNKLAADDPKRFEALKSCIGYLVHRYNNPSLVKAIILLDENARSGGVTNGGTGKSLLYKALSHCSETVLIDGKNTKSQSRFSNQRISLSTDIICFDDVISTFNLTDIYSMSTSGIVIEKKGKDEFSLKPEESPKIMITSNYPVNGPGGSSDARRRYEFEVSSYFSDRHTPKDEYGNLLFDDWSEDEWNKFDNFIIECLQSFLNKGLIEPKSLKLKVNRLIQNTSIEFNEFVTNTPPDTEKWIDKKVFLKQFKDFSIHMKDITPHLLTKWVKQYAHENNLEYVDKKTGEKYEFKLIKKSDDEEKQN